MSLNWANIMRTITDDPQAFFDDGGWNFLHEESDVNFYCLKFKPIFYCFQGEAGVEDSEEESSFAPSEDDSDASDEDDEEEEEDATSDSGIYFSGNYILRKFYIFILIINIFQNQKQAQILTKVKEKIGVIQRKRPQEVFIQPFLILILICNQNFI